MRLDFRQGLIQYQHDISGNPMFLQPATTNGFVQLVVSPTPTTITFAQGKADYLSVFDVSRDNAWGPMVAGQDNYLYWELDTLTSQVKYGLSTIIPTHGPVAPTQPLDGQFWFDTVNTTGKVWQLSSNKWITVIRLYAGKVIGGNTLNIVPRVFGSQVGLTNTQANAGYVMLDSQLRPLRTSTGEFLTTDTPVRIKNTVGTSGVLAVPPNAFIPVRAAENIPAMSLVYFSAADTVSLASSNPALIQKRTPVGVIQLALATNEVGVLTQSGDVTYDQWDWSASIGQPVYSDNSGKITTVRPGGLLAYRVGVIKNKNTIVFGVDAETEPQVYTAAATSMLFNPEAPITISDTVNAIGERVISVGIPAAVPGTTDGYLTKETAQSIADMSDAITALENDKLDKTGSIGIDQVTDLADKLTDLEGSIVTTLGGLTDVEVASATDKQVLTFDEVSGTWIAADPQGGDVVTSLAELTDVEVTGVVADQLLGFNGTVWVPMNVDAGPEGPAGPTGPEGPSQYEVAVEGGYVGTEEQWFQEQLTIMMDNYGVINGGTF